LATSFDLQSHHQAILNRINIGTPLKPKDLYMRRTPQLTFRSRILYIYSTIIRAEYFKHAT